VRVRILLLLSLATRANNNITAVLNTLCRAPLSDKISSSLIVTAVMQCITGAVITHHL
jgi:hypothetical protein